LRATFSSQRSLRTEQTYEHENPERVYHFSLEFLIGRSLANDILNRYWLRRRSTLPETGPSTRARKRPRSESQATATPLSRQ
jgi:glucan phosphorylase